MNLEENIQNAINNVDEFSKLPLEEQRRLVKLDMAELTGRYGAKIENILKIFFSVYDLQSVIQRMTNSVEVIRFSYIKLEDIFSDVFALAGVPEEEHSHMFVVFSKLILVTVSEQVEQRKEALERLAQETQQQPSNGSVEQPKQDVEEYNKFIKNAFDEGRVVISSLDNKTVH